MAHIPHSGFRVTTWRGIPTTNGLLADGTIIPAGMFSDQTLHGMLLVGRIQRITAENVPPEDPEPGDEEEQDDAAVQSRTRRSRRAA